MGDPCRQSVVVADNNFLSGNRVILVDNRHHPQFQKPVQRIGEIGMPNFACQIVCRNQQLGNGMVILAEQLVIDVHQFALSHSRRGLLGGNVLGAASQAQLSNAHANGSGGNQDQFVPGVANIAHGFTERFHPPDIQLARSIGQCGCTDFDNNAHSYASCV